MKKITLLLTTFSLMVVSATSVVAQNYVNAKSTTSQLAKQDVATLDPKKTAKASFWLKRGDVYYAAGKDAVQYLYQGAPMDNVQYNIGKQQKKEKVTINGKELTAWTYEYVTIYTNAEDVIASWKITKVVKEGCFDSAMAAYGRAGSMDEGAREKAEAGLKKIADHYREIGNMSNSFGDYKSGAESYVQVNKSLSSIEGSAGDPAALYLAGQFFAMDGANNQESFKNGEIQLRRAIAAGYSEVEKKDETVAQENRGSVYHYLYYCVMQGPDELTLERLTELKDILVKAVNEYPDNENVMQGLMQIYSSHSDVGTPDEVLSMIELSLEKDPDNISSWYSRGRVYSTLKNNDECIKSFENVARIKPEDFNGHFYIGVFKTAKADIISDEMRNKNYTKQVDYDADYAVLCEEYKLALPHFEKAHEINPKDLNALEYLKSLYFRIREQEGMMEKYEKYNNLYKEVAGE